MKIAVSVGQKEKAKGAESPYFRALLAVGARPEELCMITAADAPLPAGEFDGLLLTGGKDVDPQLYEEKKKFESVQIEPGRDEFELNLLDRAIHSLQPILGICRGIQVINVKFGGTLYQELAQQLSDETAPAIQHKQPSERSRPTHRITVTDPNSVLHGFIKGSAMVNSLHHQAIKNVGHALRITAHAEDGLIEAVELAENYPFFLGVQWHPEEMVEGHPEQRRIVEEFVRRCRSYASQKKTGATPS